MVFTKGLFVVLRMKRRCHKVQKTRPRWLEHINASLRFLFQGVVGCQPAIESGLHVFALSGVGQSVRKNFPGDYESAATKRTTTIPYIPYHSYYVKHLK